MTRTACAPPCWTGSVCRSGPGWGKLAGTVFRSGHLGDLNDLILLGAVAGVEMGLAVVRIPHAPGGVDAAMRSLEEGARMA